VAKPITDGMSSIIRCGLGFIFIAAVIWFALNVR
jgi:hypothetical protein